MTVGPARLTGILQQEIGQCLLSIFSDWIEERGFSIRRTQAGMLCSRKDLDMYDPPPLKKKERNLTKVGD